MATWTTRQSVRGMADCPSAPMPSTLPIPTSQWSESDQINEVDSMDDSGFYDWLESQMSVTGDMTVMERLQYLLDTGQFADINIRVGQGNNTAVFKAHRLLLATASQALYRMVYQVCPNPCPQEVTTIRVTDMKPKDFENILKYIYTDSIDCKNINVAFELLRASKKWGLAGLGIKSLTFLEEFIDDFKPETEEAKSNLFDLLVLSEETLCEMSDKCWKILLKEAEAMIPCEGFLNLSQEMAKKVICHEDLQFENQLRLFEAIRDWGLRYVQRNDLKLMQLGNVVEELIKVIDFERISDADFINTVLTSECLGKAEVISFFMTHGLEIPRNLDFNNNKQLPFWLWFCATSSDADGLAWKGKKGRTPNANNNNRKTSKHNSQLATVNETLSNICSLTKNGNVLEFNKVCRFRKGYRCPQKEIHQEHELRFRVDKNIRLLGVGFGFLFSCTDMGINVHCQGPWETRQWTDITQSYCRVSGEKQETADVRLMFLQPVKIEANQSYKVLVKLVRMSMGSSEVELWGGTGGVHCVETEDAEFYFLKAAVDPGKAVEESEGDTRPGVITELLYRMDAGEEETPTVSSVVRRRRPPPPEEEEEEVVSSPRRRRPETKEEEETQETPRRRRQRPELTLKVPETPYVRKRSPPADATAATSSKTPTEEYKPETFSSNRWRTRSRDGDSERKRAPLEEYRPTSFSTNRWITKPKETKVESDRTTSEATNYRTPSDRTPGYSSSSSWRTRRKEEEPEHKRLADSLSRKASTEEAKSDFLSSSRWRTRSREEAKAPMDTPFGNRKVKRTEDSSSLSSSSSAASHPFMRRRDAKESTSDVPFFLRSRPTDEAKTTGSSSSSSFGRSRWATSSASDDKTTPSSTTMRSRFLHASDGAGSSSLRPSGSSSLLSSRYGDSSTSSSSSLSRQRESSFPRYGVSSSYSSSRYDASGGSSSRYGSGSAPSGSASASNSRYTSPAPSREVVRYGTSRTGSGSNLAALESKYGSSGAAPSGRYASASAARGTGSGYSSLSDSAGGYKRSSPARGSGTSSSSSSSGSRYGSSAGGGSSSSSRYGSSTYSRYGSPTATSRSVKHGSPAPGSSSRYGSSAGRYSSPAPSHRTGKYSSSTPATGSSSRYGSPARISSSSRYGGSGVSSSRSNPYASTPSAESKWSSRGSDALGGSRYDSGYDGSGESGTGSGS